MSVTSRWVALGRARPGGAGQGGAGAPWGAPSPEPQAPSRHPHLGQPGLREGEQTPPPAPPGGGELRRLPPTRTATTSSRLWGLDGAGLETLQWALR